MKSWIVLSVSSLLLVCGAASFYYVFDDFVHAAGDNRSAMTIDANHPDASNNGAEIFAAGTLSGQGQKIADPLFPFELEALAISRSVEVYYERRQTRYHRVRGGSRLVRNSVLRDQGKIYIQQGKIAQFGSDSADDNAEPPEFVARTLDLLPDTIVYAAQIKLGNFIIEPEAIEPGVMGTRSYPEFTNAELQSFLDSRQGSGLKELMQEIGLKGVVVDPEQSSVLILYRQSAAARSDGDVRVSFEALIPQPVGVMAVQKGVTELTRVIHPEMSELGNGMPGRLDIQYGQYSDFDAYRKDALYSPVNYEDRFLFGGAGGALLLLGMFGVFAGWQRLSHAG